MIKHVIRYLIQRVVCQFILVSAGNTVVASAPAMLCDGEGHMIRVVVTGNQTLLWVDGQPGRSEETHDPVDLQAPSSTFIGGLPGTSPVHTHLCRPPANSPV